MIKGEEAGIHVQDSEMAYAESNIGRVSPDCRVDIVEGPIANPTAVHDLKTGSATLTPARIRQIQTHVPGGSKVPVIEVRP